MKLIILPQEWLEQTWLDPLVAEAILLAGIAVALGVLVAVIYQEATNKYPRKHRKRAVDFDHSIQQPRELDSREKTITTINKHF